MRIIYVEDNPANLYLVKRVARMGNHEVLNYVDGEDVLTNFEEDDPDLILMDIQLVGELSGLDVVKKLRKQGHQTPIIAVTAYAMSGDRERCLDAGCNDYMAKPLSVPMLIDVIKRYESRIRTTSDDSDAPKTQPFRPERAASDSFPLQTGTTAGNNRAENGTSAGTNDDSEEAASGSTN